MTTCEKKQKEWTCKNAKYNTLKKMQQLYKQIVKNSFVRLIRGNRRKEENVCKR